MRNNETNASGIVSGAAAAAAVAQCYGMRNDAAEHVLCSSGGSAAGQSPLHCWERNEFRRINGSIR